MRLGQQLLPVSHIGHWLVGERRLLCGGYWLAVLVLPYETYREGGQQRGSTEAKRHREKAESRKPASTEDEEHQESEDRETDRKLVDNMGIVILGLKGREWVAEPKQLSREGLFRVEGCNGGSHPTYSKQQRREGGSRGNRFLESFPPPALQSTDAPLDRIQLKPEGKKALM